MMAFIFSNLDIYIYKKKSILYDIFQEKLMNKNVLLQFLLNI